MRYSKVPCVQPPHLSYYVNLVAFRVFFVQALAFYLQILSVLMSPHWFKTHFLLLSVCSLHRPCEVYVLKVAKLAKAGAEWFSAY